MNSIWEKEGNAEKYFPEDLVRLREIEKEFKRFYELTGFCTQDHAISEQAFSDLLQKEYPAYRNLKIGDPADYEDALMEDRYFQSQLDISAVENVRYMPAILHRHQFFEVACVLSGKFLNFSGEQTMPMTTGDILIMPPGSVHGVCTYEDDGILVNILMRATTFEQHFLSLLPDDDLLRGFFTQALYKAPETPYLLFRTGNDPVIREDITRITHEFSRNNRYKNTMLSSLLSLFFVDLMRLHEKDVVIPTLNASVMNQTTIFIIEYMQKNFRNITLNHLAAFFNYSERQMQRIIRTATGYSFSENILQIRMRHAKTMLRAGNDSVQEIADALGYFDASSFRKAFRESVGMTPQAYRAMNTEK